MTRTDVAWLGGQGVVFVLAYLVVPRWPGPGQLEAAWLRPTGSAVLALGLAFAAWAMITLGRQLVPQPTPVADGTLVTDGPYRVVRHPIYLGVLLTIAGSLLRVASPAGAVLLVLSVVFFGAKSAHEERLLAAAYGEPFAAFQQRTRWRIVPGVV